MVCYGLQPAILAPLRCPCPASSFVQFDFDAKAIADLSDPERAVAASTAGFRRQDQLVIKVALGLTMIGAT
jgi:hypothetical protein